MTQHNDNARTGAYLNEAVLNVSNVKMDTFGKLFSRTIDGYAYAQPLVVSGLSMPGGARRNIVFVATEHNSVYAFNADDAAESTPIWVVHLGAPIPSAEIFSRYVDVGAEVGITSTPVIDLIKNAIYVVAKSKGPDGRPQYTFHALDLRTGSEKFGGPLEVTAAVQASATSSSDAPVKFDARVQLNRPGLLLMNGIVYVAFGSHGDKGNYHGWVLGYDSATLRQVAIFNTTPTGEKGAIWQGGQGLAGDGQNIFLSTGNGTFNAQATGGANFSQTILRLSASHGLSVADWFTPYNEAELDRVDTDIGSGGPMLIPGTSLLVMAGKDGILRLLDKNKMGHYEPGRNNDIEEFKATIREFFGGTVYWDCPDSGPLIYLWGEADFIKSFKLVDGKLQTSPLHQGGLPNGFGLSDSAPLSISANGSTPGTGIVWATCPTGDATYQPAPGVLRAFDASDVSHELWNSAQNPSRDAMGNFVKFCPPTIANGKVYVASGSGQLVVYGLLSGARAR